MQSIKIKGSLRESVGKKATKALRNAEKVPCVIYGKGEPVHFSADQATFKPLVYTPKIYITTIELDNGKSYEVILHDLQFHPVTDNLLHIDFYELQEGKALTLDIPVKTEGISTGVKNGGGIFFFPNRKLSITALPKNIPDYLLVNIEELDINDSFQIKDFEVENIVFNQSEDLVVCRVAAPKIEEVVEEDELEGEEGEEGEGTEGEGAEATPKEGDSTKE